MVYSHNIPLCAALNFRQTNQYTHEALTYCEANASFNEEALAVISHQTLCFLNGQNFSMTNLISTLGSLGKVRI